jgi:hypothetical protein
MLLHGFPHPFRERHRCLGRRPGKNQHEFLSAISADTVDFARRDLEERRQLA